MTDITELAQIEKFEAWAHSQKLSLSYGDCGYVFSSTEMAWRAWRASSADMVEALEAKDATIAELQSRAEAADKLQDSAFRDGLKAGFSYGQTDDQDGFERCMTAYSVRGKNNG